MTELEQRVAKLEHEIDVLKNQVLRSLLDIQKQLADGSLALSQPEEDTLDIPQFAPTAPPIRSVKLTDDNDVEEELPQLRASTMY